MSSLKRLLVMSATIVAIGLLGGLSVFADCEDEDTYVCEDQNDFDLDENQDLEEEEQDLDDDGLGEYAALTLIGIAVPQARPAIVAFEVARNVFNDLAIEAHAPEPLPGPPAMANPEAQHLVGND